MAYQESEPLGDLELLKNKLLDFLRQPLYSIDELKEQMIPETGGIYAFYGSRQGQARPEIMYIGIVSRTDPRPRLSTGLRFRIWEKHCGTRGEDNFRMKVKELRRLDSLEDTKNYIRSNFSCRWMEAGDLELLQRLEHFFIAVLNPLFND